MNEVNRRNMLGAAGATIALAACLPDNASQENADDAKILGPGDGYDETPVIINKRERPKGYGNGSFVPDHDFLVFLKFENSRLTVKSRFFDNTGVDAAQSLTRAAASFANHTNWSASDPGYREDFKNFGFATQTRLYFFVGNAPEDAKFDPVNKVVMAAYFAKDGNSNTLKKLKKNNSFWNDELVTKNGMEMLLVENWYAYQNGGKIDKALSGDLTPSKQVGFSMNIHLKLNDNPLDPDSCIYVVIDPDGTNGIKKP